MEPREASEVFLACQECIGRYILARRAGVAAFVARRFSAAASLRLHGRSLWQDFLCYPVNALWALPYLFLQKITQTLDRLGFDRAEKLFAHVPQGLRTHYQREIESRIRSELLEWPEGLFDELQRDTRLAPLMQAGRLSADRLFPTAPVAALVEKHSAARTVIADLSGSAGTMLLGWLMFRDQSLSIAALGSRLAYERARDRAVSHFFLGKGLGKAWYTLVPPEPTRLDFALGLGFVGLLVVGICLAVSLIADPLRNALGLHHRTLHTLVDGLEEQLHLQASRSLRGMLGETDAAVT
jgi:hypothetical protein